MKRAITAGWADTSCPDLADLLPPGIDAGQFGEWLGELLGHYRSSETLRTTMPSASEEAAHLQALCDQLDAARDAVTAPLPPLTDATTFAAAHFLGVDWFALRRRLDADLSTAHSVLQVAAGRMPPGTRGRPQLHARDALLRAVVDRLRSAPMSAAAAGRCAEAILIRCCVPVPSTESTSGARAVQRAAAAVKVPK